MNKNRTTQSGYSLAEILVAVAIFAVIVLAALMTYDRSNREFKAGVEAANLQQNTRVAFDKLVGDLRSVGFDFDRDGIPAGSVGGVNQYQQPDEQFEYIGPHAIAIRGNFDYETESAPCPAVSPDNCDNGRERTYESTQFPVVTTGNDEIVAYGLVPDSQTTIPACNPATNCIRFFADTAVPRRSYPAAGGGNELLVSIPGVDLGVAVTTGTYMGQTCTTATPCFRLNNPPYTLYRFTLDRAEQDFSAGANVVRTALATNIRAVTFKYYQDAQGFVPLKDLQNTNDVSTGAQILGAGQYVVSNPTASVPQRVVRAKINSVKIELIGMNEGSDPGYTMAGETIASVRNRRQYRLETLISPRNIQKRGMKEQDTIAPGAPTDVNICTGRCGGVYLSWTAPVVNASQGAPDQYQIVYDLQSQAGFRYRSTTFANTFGYVFPEPGDPPMTPNLEYKFAVVALNSFGSATAAPVRAFPRNNTDPRPPDLQSATASSGMIRLVWRRPATDQSGAMSCTPSGTVGNAIPASEIFGYRVERTTTPAIPASWSEIANETTVNSTANTVTWDDTTVMNCVTYHYRVTAVERCSQNASYNLSGDINQAISDVSPVTRNATPAAVDDPKPPTSFTIDQNSPKNIVTGTADVNMSWSKVTQDMQDNPINPSAYKVYRRQIAPATTAWAVVRTMTMSGPSPATLTWQDMNLPVGAGQIYEYYVTAEQCASTPRESGQSNVEKYPCVFNAAAVNNPPLTSNAFDGSGLELDAWFVVDTATVTVNTRTGASPAVVSATATIYDEQNEVIPGAGGTDVLPPFQWTWTVGSDQTNRIDVTLLDSNGCTTAYTRFVEDQVQSCCLIPFSADSTVVEFTAGESEVDFILKNVCNGTLDIQSVTINWTGVSPQRVLFPTATGTDSVNITGPPSATSATVSPGGSVIDVPAGSTDYKITVKYQNTIAGSNPITGFTVRYIRQGDSTSEDCPTVP